MYGPNHPELAFALGGLAELLASQGKHRDALPAFERALLIAETVLAPDHPDVGLILEREAVTLKNLGRAGDAAAAQARADAIRAKHVPKRD
ncbi:MAG: tetratricopeptide repeat protein [Rhodospirillales bacterium]|nr:tetratricopeptide repeat protein [Rhodospirillales bacterium]